MTVVTQRGTIRAKHSIREEFSLCSTGNGGPYYQTKGMAIHAYESTLAKYGLCFNCDQLIDMPGDDGRITVEVWTDRPEYSESVGSAFLMWHRMDRTGRWEFTGYIT